LKDRYISSTESKNNLVTILKDAEKSGESFIITKRKKPVAIIVSYEAYIQNRKRNNLNELQDLLKMLINKNVTATSLYNESKKELEMRDQ
jgi:prevent-host-death family protein